MRAWWAAALFAAMTPVAAAADLPPEPAIVFEDVGEVAVTRPARRVVTVVRTCVKCSGHGLPLGGLRKPAVAHVPLGGLRSACPPARRITRSVVLSVKG